MNSEIKDFTDLKIYAAFHKEFATPSVEYIVPIQGGRSISSINLSIDIDNDNENISDKNKTFCELTVLYNIWKNKKYLPATYWGLCHYRRYFTLDIHWTRLKKKKFYYLPVADNNTFPKIFSKRLFSFFSKNLSPTTVIVSRPNLAIPPNQKEAIPVKDFYINYHDPNGWQIMEEAIKQLHPIYLESFKIMGNQRELHACNMLIAHFSFWEGYLDWLFSIIFFIEERYELPKDDYQNRALGFMAERLMNVYLIHHREIKKIELPIAILQ